MRWILRLAALTVLGALLFVPADAQVPNVTLTWTAPGDDGTTGTATAYEMRWSATKPDTTTAAKFDTWWSGATVVNGLPLPAVAGASQSVTITPTGGWASGKTYYFVLRAADEVPNWSVYSNAAWKAVTDTIRPAGCTDLRAQ
jgi:hypothetical protein